MIIHLKEFDQLISLDMVTHIYKEQSFKPRFMNDEFIFWTETTICYIGGGKPDKLEKTLRIENRYGDVEVNDITGRLKNETIKTNVKILARNKYNDFIEPLINEWMKYKDQSSIKTIM